MEQLKETADKVQEAVGIRFEACGKLYGFKASGLSLKRGELVVVESDLGLGIGRVVSDDLSVKDSRKEMKPVLRRVTEEDLKKEDENNALRLEARNHCIERIKARGLPMKLTGTDVMLDRKRIIFYFVAESRIDFRELVKDLAAKFRTRIELRQIGVRDAAKMAGGLGPCGRELCCKSFLTSFGPISIKMAKQQALVLNTSKLSGLCGRLMCCLSYEWPGGAAPKEKGAAPKEKGAAHREKGAAHREKGSAHREKAPVHRERGSAPGKGNSHTEKRPTDSARQTPPEATSPEAASAKGYVRETRHGKPASGPERQKEAIAPEQQKPAIGPEQQKEAGGPEQQKPAEAGKPTAKDDSSTAKKPFRRHRKKRWRRPKKK